MSFSATVVIHEREHHVSASLTDEAGSRCGLMFNPGGHLDTEKIKGFSAAAMQSVIDVRNQIPPLPENATEGEKAARTASMRCCATALTHLEAAQMFGVKALHTRANAGVTD